MRTSMIRLAAIGTVFAVSFIGSSASLIATALADQKDPRLPALFESLSKAPDSDEAAQIDAKIWDIWDNADDPNLETLLVQGTQAMENGDYWTALQDFNIIIEQRPEFAEGWNKRAALYYLTGEYEKSLADIDRTLKLEPRHMCALSGRGLVDMKLERYEDAMTAYQRVLDIDPQIKASRPSSSSSPRSSEKTRSKSSSSHPIPAASVGPMPRDAARPAAAFADFHPEAKTKSRW